MLLIRQGALGAPANVDTAGAAATSGGGFAPDSGPAALAAALGSGALGGGPATLAERNLV